MSNISQSKYHITEIGPNLLVIFRSMKREHDSFDCTETELCLLAMQSGVEIEKFCPHECVFLLRVCTWLVPVPVGVGQLLSSEPAERASAVLVVQPQPEMVI